MTSPLTPLPDNKVDYAPNVEIDPEFDRQARDWMYRAELPAGWAGEIARDYQRRAAKPPSADEVAQEREAVLGRLRKDWGDATDAKLAQVRSLIGGIGDDRLTETLDRSGLGNNEWLVRQLAVLADRKAAKTAEKGNSERNEGSVANSDADATDRGIGHRPSEDNSDPHVLLLDKSGISRIGETVGPEIARVGGAEEGGRDATPKRRGHPGGGKGGGGGGGWGDTNATDEQVIDTTVERPVAVIVDTPDGPYLLRRTYKGKIVTQQGTAAHRWSRDEVNKRSLHLEYPPSADEAKAIQDRLDRGEVLDAPTRNSADYPRMGKAVVVEYPIGQRQYLRDSQGNYLHAPGKDDLVIPAEQAIALGLGDWGVIPPPKPHEKPEPPMPPTSEPSYREKGSIEKSATEMAKYQIEFHLYEIAMKSYEHRQRLYTKGKGSAGLARIPTDQD